MKSILLIVMVLAGCLSAYSQISISLEDKALLTKMLQDKSFTLLDRNSAEYLFEINSLKQNLYKAYLAKSPDAVKILKKSKAGYEGQYLMTWFSVEQGKD